MRRNKEWIILTKKDEVLKIWTEFFKELLGKQDRETQELIEYLNEPDDHEHSSKPTEEEVRDEIDNLKKNKAPGLDGIQAELLKNGTSEILQIIYKLIEMIWTREVITDEWKVGVICLIHKKGDPMICNNPSKYHL